MTDWIHILSNSYLYLLKLLHLLFPHQFTSAPSLFNVLLYDQSSIKLIIFSTWNSKKPTHKSGNLAWDLTLQILKEKELRQNIWPRSDCQFTFDRYCARKHECIVTLPCSPLVILHVALPFLIEILLIQHQHNAHIVWFSFRRSSMDCYWHCSRSCCAFGYCIWTCDMVDTQEEEMQGGH